jgi:hypothetical protein
MHGGGGIPGLQFERETEAFSLTMHRTQTNALYLKHGVNVIAHYCHLINKKNCKPFLLSWSCVSLNFLELSCDNSNFATEFSLEETFHENCNRWGY